MRDGDLGVVKEITVEAFDGIAIDQIIEGRHGLLRGEDWRARKVRHIDTDVSRETGAVYVGEIDGSVVGYVTTWTDEASGIGHIPNLAVRVEHSRAWASAEGSSTTRWTASGPPA